ncbi:MAG: pro-sigmaK processing inhibitor BofA family protein, partial [Lachnospiraceae bacterium]|nr:pro-sigmaK processing inhibitor BofA family protein [Lachnospiraceae bacterium]
MNKEIGVIAIVVICLLVLCVGLLKKRAEFLFTFLVRMVVGGIAIFFTNKFFASQEIDLMV